MTQKIKNRSTERFLGIGMTGFEPDHGHLLKIPTLTHLS
jgi:hypothetical protein